jgi:hypothetical protein
MIHLRTRFDEAHLELKKRQKELISKRAECEKVKAQMQDCASNSNLQSLESKIAALSSARENQNAQNQYYEQIIRYGKIVLPVRRLPLTESPIKPSWPHKPV